MRISRADIALSLLEWWREASEWRQLQLWQVKEWVFDLPYMARGWWRELRRPVLRWYCERTKHRWSVWSSYIQGSFWSQTTFSTGEGAQTVSGKETEHGETRFCLRCGETQYRHSYFAEDLRDAESSAQWEAQMMLDAALSDLAQPVKLTHPLAGCARCGLGFYDCECDGPHQQWPMDRTDNEGEE